MLITYARSYYESTEDHAAPPAWLREQATRLVSSVHPRRVHVLTCADHPGAILAYGVAQCNPAWSVTFTPELEAS